MRLFLVLVLAGFFVNLGEGLSLAKVTRGVANTRDYARGKGIKKERVDFLPPNYEVLHLGNANEKDKQEQPILEFIQKLIADKIAPRLTNVFFKAVTDYLVPTAETKLEKDLGLIEMNTTIHERLNTMDGNIQTMKTTMDTNIRTLNTTMHRRLNTMDTNIGALNTTMHQRLNTLDTNIGALKTQLDIMNQSLLLLLAKLVPADQTTMERV